MGGKSSRRAGKRKKVARRTVGRCLHPTSVKRGAELGKTAGVQLERQYFQPHLSWTESAKQDRVVLLHISAWPLRLFDSQISLMQSWMASHTDTHTAHVRCVMNR